MVPGLRIDENSARYYVELAGGDLKRAFALYGPFCSVILELVKPSFVSIAFE